MATIGKRETLMVMFTPVKHVVANECAVTITQKGKNKFTVQYGQQITKNLTYEEAAKEMGQCLMHSMVCAGWIESN